MSAFTKNLFRAELKIFSEEEYLQKSKTFISDFLNAKVDNELIRVPFIGKYLKFHSFSYSDYLLIAKNTADLMDSKNKFFCYAELDMALHFRDFLKEYHRYDTGLNNIYDDNYLIQVADTDMYHYVPLKVENFPSLMVVKQHLNNRIIEKFELLKSSFDSINSVIPSIQFFVPKGEYSMNKNQLKIIVELKF